MLSALFDMNPNGVAFVRLSNGEILDCNPEYLNQIGYSREEVVGHTSKDLKIFPYDEKLKAITDEIHKNKEINNLELCLNVSDGSFIDILYSARLINIDGEEIILNVGHNITGRKRAENELKNNEAHYHHLFNSMTEMFQIIELIYEDGVVVDYYYREINPAFEKFVEKSKEQLIDKRAKDIFGVIEDYWLELYDRVLKTGKPEQFENYGAELNKYYLGHVWKVGENRIATLFTDFTEHITLEKERVERNDKFKAIFENSLDAVLISLPDGNILAANRASEKMFGYSEAELCKLGVNGITDNQESNIHELLDMENYTGKTISGFKFVKKNGTNFLAEISASIYKNKDGNLKSSIIIRNITESKKTEEELKHSHQKIDEILESIKEPFYVLDHDYKFIYMNETAASLLNMEPEDFIGKTFWEMFPKDLGTPIEENYRDAMINREIRQFEIKSLYADVYVIITVYPTHEGISIIGKDITESKKAAQKLAEQAFMLSNINDAVIGTDDKYMINFWSKSAEKMYGYSE